MNKEAFEHEHPNFTNYFGPIWNHVDYRLSVLAQPLPSPVGEGNGYRHRITHTIPHKSKIIRVIRVIRG